ncbi:MAG: chromate resistance protein ChrB domain-containing protein, partial [Pseudomonadota bacterium]
DYFAGPAAEQAGQALSEAEAALAALLSPGEPQPQTGRIARLDSKAYRNRAWATRARPWVDRMGSAWLIKRFIDSKARFLWLKDPKDCPRNALGFDFDGATFTHVGARVTFEVLLASFGLDGDKALVRLGELVHFLDVGGVPVAEARGLEMILTGAREQYRDDDKLLAEAGKNFDYLYQAYSEG